MKKKLCLCMTLFVMMLALSGCDSEFGNKMAKAGMNTVMGMGTVFIVLILFAFIISLFKYISVFEKWLNSRGHKNDVPKPEPGAPAAEIIEDEEDVDDLELVAVITAALAATLNTSTDKLIVRSIRRRNSNRW